MIPLGIGAGCLRALVAPKRVLIMCTSTPEVGSRGKQVLQVLQCWHHVSLSPLCAQIQPDLALSPPALACSGPRDASQKTPDPKEESP